MDYVALIDKLQSLPKDKQGTVFDFDEFLFSRYQSELGQDKTLAQSSLAYSITNPQVVADFTPLSRDEANGGQHFHQFFHPTLNP